VGQGMKPSNPAMQPTTGRRMALLFDD
jgi:hypothetical protein